MPAHRSSDEADIRNDVVAHIRQHWPSARIIHEINVSGQGSNRIDVLAVAPESMLAVEIKSKKDKLDRLPDQMAAMRRAAHFSIAAIHEKFLVPKSCGAHAAHGIDENGAHFIGEVPRSVDNGPFWIWPKRRRALPGASYDWLEKWDTPAQPMSHPLPAGALEMLWAAELRWLCHRLRIGVGPRTNMSEMVRLLRWMSNGKELTRGICEALRRRDCVEADAPIEATAKESA